MGTTWLLPSSALTSCAVPAVVNPRQGWSDAEKEKEMEDGRKVKGGGGGGGGFEEKMRGEAGEEKSDGQMERGMK